MAVMDIIIKASDQASKVMQNIGASGSGAAKSLADNWLKVTAISGTAGVAFEALARNQQGLTEQTRNLAASIGLAEGKVRSLVLSTADVGFSIEEVISTMQVGREEGLKSGDALQKYAKFWDEVGDASGGVPQELAAAGVSLNALGIDAKDQGDAVAALGFIIRDTTQSVPAFLAFVGKAGPSLRAMKLDVNDTAAIFGVLEQELGLSGRVAKGVFTKAVNTADGSLEKMLKTLGITNDTFDQYRQKVAASSNVVKEQAANNDRSFTTMQRMEAWAERMKYKYGDLIEVMGSMAPLMIALGPALKIFSGAWGFLKNVPGYMKSAVDTIKSLPTVLSMVREQGLKATLQAGKLWPAISKVASSVSDFASKAGSSAITGFKGLLEGAGSSAIGAAAGIAGVTLAVAALIISVVEAVKAFRSLQEAWKQEHDALEQEKSMMKRMYEIGGKTAVENYLKQNEASMTTGSKVILMSYLGELINSGPGGNKPVKMAGGGITNGPTYALVGEEEKEVISPLSQLPKLLGLAGGGKVTHDHTGTITVKGINDAGQVKAIMPIVLTEMKDELRRELRRG